MSSAPIAQHLYISTGETTKMFTLRLFTKYHKHTTNEYLCNLSIDHAKAVAKAQQISKEMMIPLRESVAAELNEITRMNAAEREARLARRVAENEELQKQIALEIVQRKAAVEASSKFLTGKHEGYEMEEVFASDPEYIEWICGQDDVQDPTHLWQFTNIKVKSLFGARVAELKKLRDGADYVGAVGDKLLIQVRCVKRIALEQSYGFNSSWADMYLMVDSNQNVFMTVYSGTAWEMKVGDTYQVKGTVKDHVEYKGTKQTVLTRCKLVD